MTPPSETALLTPVPLEHLESGLDVCEREGRVAYGSDNGMVLAELAAAANGAECPVLFYASHSADHGPAKVTWIGRFVRIEGAKAGRHPFTDRLRPTSTANDGAFVAFYEVADLRRAEPHERLPLSSLKTLAGKKLAANFVPLGPTLVQNPF